MMLPYEIYIRGPGMSVHMLVKTLEDLDVVDLVIAKIHARIEKSLDNAGIGESGRWCTCCANDVEMDHVCPCKGCMGCAGNADTGEAT